MEYDTKRNHTAADICCRLTNLSSQRPGNVRRLLAGTAEGEGRKDGGDGRRRSTRHGLNGRHGGQSPKLRGRRLHRMCGQRTNTARGLESTVANTIASAATESSPFRRAKSIVRTTSPTQHVRLPGFCHCCSVRLEQFSGPCPQMKLLSGAC